MGKGMRAGKKPSKPGMGSMGGGMQKECLFIIIDAIRQSCQQQKRDKNTTIQTNRQFPFFRAENDIKYAPIEE